MEMSVDDAKNNLLWLLRKVEDGEEVIIKRGNSGPTFKIIQLPVPVEIPKKRNLEPNPEWKGKIKYRDEDIWESELQVRE